MTHTTPLLLALLASTGAAWAQHAPVQLPELNIRADARPASALDLDTPTAAGSRLGLSPRENPASVSTLERAQIEQSGARNALDIANSLPGVNASAPPGHGGFVAYRGFIGSQVNQLYNGISLQYGSANRPLDAWIFERVELLGGPSSFLHGSGSVGGSLNYVTRLASRDDQLFEGRLGYASFDQRELAFGVNRALNSGPGVRHFARLDYSRTDGNGYIDRQQRQAGNLAFSLLSDLTAELSHTLAIEYLEEREDSPYWGTPTLNPQRGELKIDPHTARRNYNVADGRYEQRVRWLRSITDYHLSDAASLRNTVYHYRGQRDYRNLEVYRYSPDNSSVARSGAYLQRHAQELNGNRLEYLRQAELFGLLSDWALGLDVNRNQQTTHPRSLAAVHDNVDPHAFDPGSFDDIAGMTRTWRKGRSTEVDTLALFVENRQQLAERWALVTALRYDHIELDATNHPTAERYQRRWDAVTGRLGLVYELSEAASLYAQYSTSAEPSGGALTGSRFLANGDYDLSSGRQLEVGSKLDILDGRGSATVALYRIVRQDFPVADPANPNSTILAGQQTSTGLELAAALRLTPKLLAQANWAWVDAQYDRFEENVGGVAVSRKGRSPVNVPRQVGNLWLSYELSPAWQVGVDARHVGSVYANNANSLWVPSYTLFGGFLRHRLDEQTDLTLRGRNLSDRRYARFVHQSNAQYYLGEPRSVELTLQTRF